MKVNRTMVARAGLKLLNEVGLEQLTLRLIGSELSVQAATIYWHFKSKQELLDEMATTVLAEGASNLLSKKADAAWDVLVVAFGTGLRKTLLAYPDGAKMVAGTRLTNTEYMKTVELIGSELVRSGFTVRQTAILLSTVYDYTLSLVMEEQVVFSRPGERSSQYDLDARNAALDPAEFPILRQSGAILFDNFDRRYREGLQLIVQGAAQQAKPAKMAPKQAGR
jgi:TetR/AcrR family tetracycline transcriptional repressor